ncbi:unnamed protein product [Hermetia illucens]|uniref:Uncharacterized protein n=1 Tax=Hermetia illucens TaxID=343691 RepID=A0A7R8YMS0_HERIL|nr:unnamed protein product [Hermetia illucens]
MHSTLDPQVSPHQIVIYDNRKDRPNDTEASILGIKLVITPKHFRTSKFKLACLARIYNIYEQLTEKLIDLDASTNLILFDDPLSTMENNKQSQYANNLADANEDIKMHHMQAQVLVACICNTPRGNAFRTPRDNVEHFKIPKFEKLMLEERARMEHKTLAHGKCDP